MPSLVSGYTCDVFISYRQKDNRQDAWVTQFVKALQHELDATFKEDVSIYFDVNPHDGLLETHDVGDSLKDKLKCLIFIPIVSQTYCDPRSFAWEHEFLAFKKLASEDPHGLKIKLPGGNVANRILPVRIHELDSDDLQLMEKELGGVLRSVDFIYKSSGVNRPLTPKDDEVRTAGQTLYRDQVNKVANSIKELIGGMRNVGGEFSRPLVRKQEIGQRQSAVGFWQELKRRNVFRVASIYAIVGWIIIQVGSSVFGPLHIPEWALTFLIVVILMGFPIAIILAWAFEVSPEGTVVPARSAGSQINSASRKLPITTIAFVLLIIIVISQFAYFKFFSTPVIPEAQINDKSIAVIPFTNMTGDKEQEYFSDGMTEEILNHLSKITSIRVISRQSSMKYKDSKLTLREIAAALGVANVLEGSVRRSGEKVRITAQLIDASTDKHLWSEDYDYRDLKDIFAVQTDVSIQIANRLKAKLTSLEKGGLSKTYTTNVQAYKYYLKGRHFWDKRSKESYDSAEANYKRAIDLDPDYALAYSGLADCYTFNQKNLPQMEAIPIARAYAAKALALDSTLCEALTTVAFIRSHFDYDREGTRKIFERIIRDNPNYPIAHVYYGNLLLFIGNKKKAIDEAKKALKLDPLSSVINMVLGRDYYATREYDSAIHQLQKTLILNPNFKSAYRWLGMAYLKKKLYSQAITAFSKLPPGVHDFTNGMLLLSYAYTMAGRPDDAKQALEKVSQKDRAATPYDMAIVYVGLGDFKNALANLKITYESHSIMFGGMNLETAFDPLKKEPEFKELLKKLNASEDKTVLK